jgi:hypothetical protein
VLVWLRFGLWLAPRKTNSEEWRARGESRDGEIAMSRCKRLHQTSKAVRDRLLRSLAPGDSRPTRPKNFSKSEKPVDGGSRRVQTQKEEPLRLQLVTPAYVPRGSLIQHWFYAAKAWRAGEVGGCERPDGRGTPDSTGDGINGSGSAQLLTVASEDAD